MRDLEKEMWHRGWVGSSSIPTQKQIMGSCVKLGGGFKYLWNSYLKPGRNDLGHFADCTFFLRGRENS